MGSTADWLLKALHKFIQQHDNHYAGMAVRHYAQLLQPDKDDLNTQLEQKWREAGLEKIISLEQLKEASNE